jgi:hypothetical protein
MQTRTLQLQAERKANSAAIEQAMLAVPSFHDHAYQLVRGNTVFVIGAGPSVTMAYSTIREKAGVTFACLRAHDELCRQGCEPDYTFHCDPQPLMFHVEYPVRRLVLGDHVHPSLLDLPHEELYGYRNINNPVTQHWPHGPIESGGSIAHDMFCHAAMARAQCILLCGVDLAFPCGKEPGQHHAPGMDGGATRPNGTILAPDWNGMACETLPLYAAYANWFAAATKHRPQGHVWAVLGGCLRIPGWDHVGLT